MKSRIPPIAFVFCLLLPLIVFADAESPTGSAQLELRGMSAPGVLTDVLLNWTYDGPIEDGMKFHLFRMDTSETGVIIAELDLTTATYTDQIPYMPGGVNYRLALVVNSEEIAEVSTLALIAKKNGIAFFEGVDRPGDAGRAIDLSWKVEDEANESIEYFKIYRTPVNGGKWTEIAHIDPATVLYTDEDIENESGYNYMIRAFAAGAIYESNPVVNVTSHAAWFNMRKINLFIIALIVMFSVSWYVFQSGRRDMFIRKIAGLEAVEEAVGRATEMGRSVLYVPGIQDLDDVQTIAGLTILGSVAKLTAEYETKLDVPVSRSLVMSNGREVVKESYLSVGRPDFYHDDIVHYVTDEQFGYVAAVDGIMVREEPAACFYLGAFYAESLILAETGNHVGAIQIAGTAMPTQLPFFVAACDYTLIGEELFAASAYLSGDKKMIASLRGQDVGKFIAMIAILFGSVMTTLATLTGGGFIGNLSEAFNRLFAMNF